jgi:hypothetical protein
MYADEPVAISSPGLENKSFPTYPFIEMVASFISSNLCRLYLYQAYEGLAIVRESNSEKYRHNSN